MRQFSWLLGVLGGFVVATFLAYATWSDTIGTSWAVAGGVGAVLIGVWIWLDRESLGRSMSTRGARFTWVSLAMVIMGLGIAAAANVLAYRYDKRWDVTASGVHTLSEQSVKVIKGLDRQVLVKAFFTSGSEEEGKFKDLIQSYEDQSDKIVVELHDPLREPMLAQKNDITSAYGTVVLTSGDDKQRLESDFGEEALTNAIIRLTSDKEHVICFTEGHEELDPDDDSQGTGMGVAVTKLEGQNYTVKKVLLARESKVPADCEVLVAADPQTDWLPSEREMAAAYVAGGGHFLLMLDPTHAPQLAADMTRYGIKVGDDIVIESNPNYQVVGGDASYIILDPSSFAQHAITSPIKGAVMMRVARSVARLPDDQQVKGIQVQELAHTSEYAWAETTLDGSTVPKADPGQDIIGKVPLMAVAEITDPSALRLGPISAPAAGETRDKPEVVDLAKAPAGAGATPQSATTPQTEETDTEVATAPASDTSPAGVVRKKGGKVVVIGDSDFASNELIGQLSNLDLVLNTISWLSGEEDQVSIRPNAASSGGLSMNVIEGLVVWLASLLFLPGAAVVGAVATWRRRRNL